MTNLAQIWYNIVTEMAKTTGPLFGFSARGTVAKLLTFRRRDRRTIAEAIPTHPDAKSPAQLSWRTMYEACSALWHTLSAIEKASWEAAARAKHMTGYALWQSQCLRPNPGIYLPLAGGTMAGGIDMASNLITHLHAPAAIGDAANKDYADSLLSAHTALPSAHHVKTSFVEIMNTDHQLANINVWEDWDLSAIIPVGTIAVLAMARQAGTGSEMIGIRKNGSGDDRRFYAFHHVPVMYTIQVGADRIIECDCSNKTDAYFGIYGYWI